MVISQQWRPAFGLTHAVAFAAWFVLAALSSHASGADAPFLEELTMSGAGDTGEMHIVFSTPIRYVRHFPEEKGNALHVFIELADACAAEEVLAQETKWLPKTDEYPRVTVSFPESIRRSMLSPAYCNANHRQVYTGYNLLVKFDREINFKVRPGGDGHSIVVALPLLNAQPKAQVETETPPATQPQAIPVPLAPTREQPVQSGVQAESAAPAPAKEPELPPTDLFMAGRTALSKGDALTAVQQFNRLLNLPPNDYSRDAQELVGVAREQAGEYDKAKAEYQLYLKLYPDGEGSDRVKQRLAALEASMVAPKAAKQVAKPKKAVREIHQNTFTGSLSQYYYAGKTQSHSINGADEVTKIRSIDQSTLITNVDATGRFRHNQYDTKIVFRDTEVHNALPGIMDRNTLSAAYIEHQNKADDYMFRIGRQSGVSQGVLGRFDGVFGRLGLNPQWRITAVAGEPDNGSHSSVQTKRHFYGMGVEFGPLAEKWSGTVYGIQQSADGLVERRALGTELRYFNGTTSWFGLMDYDTIYDAVNMAMLQGNWTADGGYNFNMLLDHRKSPVLYAETAIQSLTGAKSVHDLRMLLSSGDIYSNVKGLVPESDMAMFGITKQLTPRWQVGGDIRAVKIGATDGAGPIEAQPGISDNYTLTLQAVGSDTLFKNDVSVIMASFVQDPQYNAQNFAVSNSVLLQEKWRIDGSLRYYQEKRDAGQKTWQISPGVRLNYRWRDNMSFEAQLNFDRTYTDDPISVTKTTTWRETLFAGYRWDFR